MLEQEFKYFQDNQKELTAKYAGKHVVIVGNEVVGAYGTENEAYMEAVKKHPVGTFLIQYCGAKGETFTQTFHSRVSFA